MPLTLSTEALADKNEQNSSMVWILLLELDYTDIEAGSDIIRICYNNEDIIWDSVTWTGAPFQLGDITEGKDGEIPTVSLAVLDPYRRISISLDNYSGMIGCKVYIRVIHQSKINTSVAELEFEAEVTDTSVDGDNTIHFTLGAENLMRFRLPQDRYMKDFCRYDEFAGSLCGYGLGLLKSAPDTGHTECNRTWADCVIRGNQGRYGGQPGLDRLGIIT